MSRSVVAGWSAEKRRLRAPNDVGCTAKFDHTPIGLPSAASTRITVKRVSIESALRAAGSLGMSVLWTNCDSKRRLFDAVRSSEVPTPMRAGVRFAFAPRIASVIPLATCSNTLGS